MAKIMIRPEDYLRDKLGGSNVWVYGMSERGFAPGAQPMDGIIGVAEDPEGLYYSLLIYLRELGEDEVRNYELDFLYKTTIEDITSNEQASVLH